MNFPLIGQAKRKAEQRNRFQEEMMEKLQKWELQEGIRVEPVLLADRRGIYAKLEFRRIDENTKAIYAQTQEAQEIGQNQEK